MSSYPQYTARTKYHTITMRDAIGRYQDIELERRIFQESIDRMKAHIREFAPIVDHVLMNSDLQFTSFLPEMESYKLWNGGFNRHGDIFETVDGPCTIVFNINETEIAVHLKVVPDRAYFDKLVSLLETTKEVSRSPIHVSAQNKCCKATALNAVYSRDLAQDMEQTLKDFSDITVTIAKKHELHVDEFTANRPKSIPAFDSSNGYMYRATPPEGPGLIGIRFFGWKEWYELFLAVSQMPNKDQIDPFMQELRTAFLKRLE